MRFVDVIARKRDGHALSREEIDLFVGGFVDGSIPDYQASALLMAVVLRGMTGEETWALTDAMVRSGERVDLSDLPGVKVGKHSTGGVGDKISIILGPVAAACGVIVPKMSGRGLGHTGGTLDKLESIPGYRVDLTIAEFKSVLRDVGTSIIGQTTALAPADKKIYALRDVTSTVESVPLIASSVMSKKLAEGGNAVLLDVKCGDGAFMKSVDDARALARAMVTIGTLGGVPTEAFVTDMEAPLGRAVGNSLEVVECVDALKGGGPPELLDLVRRLTARVVVLGRIESDAGAAMARVDEALTSGRALETFARMIDRHGGDPRVVENTALLPSAPDRAVVAASRSGFLARLAALSIGRAAHVLGAGRDRVGEPVDHAVGVRTMVRVGAEVCAGQPLLELHHRGGRGLDEALQLARAAIDITDGPPPQRPLLIDICTPN